MKKLVYIAGLLIMLCSTFVESNANTQPWVARHGMTSSQYQSEFNMLGSQGFRLVYISGYTVNDEPRFAAIWEKKAGPPWVARHGMTASQFQSEFNKYTGQGFRLTLVNGYTVKDEGRY